MYKHPSLHLIKKCTNLALIAFFFTFSSYSMDHSGILSHARDKAKAQLHVELIRTVEENRLDDLKKMIAERNIDIKEVKGELDATLLHVAASRDLTKMADFLLSRGADVRARTKRYNTPIHFAAQVESDNPAMLELLLKASGGDVEIHGYMHTTPLHWAAMKGRVALVKWLVEKKADLNATTSDEVTPLTRAVSEKHANVVKILLEAGAETPLPNYHTKAPITEAIDDETLAIDDCHDVDNNDGFRYDKEVADLINLHMSADKCLQAKLAQKCCLCNEEFAIPHNYAHLHEFTCCQKIAHRECIKETFSEKKLCPLCCNNPEKLVDDNDYFFKVLLNSFLLDPMVY